MASVYTHPESKFLWGRWTDAAGNDKRGSLETTDPVEAQKRADVLERQAHGSAAPGELTVGAYIGSEEAPGPWLKERMTSRPLAWPDDLSRLTHHFLPTFEDKSLAWLGTDDGVRAMRAWVIGLPAHKAQRDGTPLASRTVHNIKNTVEVLLKDAVEEERLSVTPFARFDADRHMPEKTDKVKGWRKTAGFKLPQVFALCTSRKLRPERRVWNTISFFTGGRTGELANLRFRDWTDKAEYEGGKLDRITISTAYNTRSNVEKGTKTGAEKFIPLHPFAESILLAWRDGGFKEWMGRDPKPDDFIVPQSNGTQWRNWQLLDRFHADLAALEFGKQRQYEGRSTFRNMLLRAGAPDFHVNLMTHAPVKQASDFYTRLDMQWPAMCEAVLKLVVPTVPAAQETHSAPRQRAKEAEIGAPSLTRTGGLRFRNAPFEAPERSISDREIPAPLPTIPPAAPLRLVPSPTAPDAIETELELDSWFCAP